MSSDSESTTSQDAAPGALALVRAFVNTFDLDESRESLDSPEALAAWMREHGVPVAGRLGEEDRSRAIAVREALRSMLLSNNGAPIDSDAVGLVRSAAAAAPLHVEIDDGGRAALRPGGSGVDGLVSRLLAAVLAAQAEGTWERLKACPAHDCEWAFYDRSRNRSRTWCSMDVCGNRSKTRSYRARKAAGAA